ncbi:hypothetical protein CBR_g54519 [Chara braunii]|uniref:Uncharacterized protein n=1 Tax=Chara braunii TaxID=69332 RepID=A0A388MC78_CHABU|nr:hypothetical protein CBR_g54519 [Chara braunii]|eukprot:GBG92167.1 hypothetical protein CBR_g54519 [Chara braunii]
MAQHPKDFRTGNGKTRSGSRLGRDIEDVKNNGHVTSSTRQMCSSWAPKDLDRESRKLMPFADVMQNMMTSAYVSSSRLSFGLIRNTSAIMGFIPTAPKHVGVARMDPAIAYVVQINPNLKPGGRTPSSVVSIPSIRAAGVPGLCFGFIRTSHGGVVVPVSLRPRRSRSHERLPRGLGGFPGTSIHRPAGFARRDSFGGGVGGEGGLPGTPPDLTVSMSDDSVEKRKRVGGGDDTPKEPSTRRRTVESSGKRLKSTKERKPDEGDTGDWDHEVEINLNTFNLDKAFFLEMKTGLQRNVVLHVHPEKILHIQDWEDAYNHRSLDAFLVDTIATAMIDCYERKDMRYTKPISVLAPIIAPPEKDKPAVCVLPQDFDASHPEKYWYYPVCGQHNARAAMKVKDHAVFSYYNFCEWPFRPIYFPNDEFDGYANVSCKDNLKDKKNSPRLQILSMRDIRNILKIKGRPRVVLGNASKKKEEVRRWTQFMALAMKKTPYTPSWGLSTEEKKKKEWAEKLRYYLPLAMADESVFVLAEKFYDEWSKGKLLASDGRRWTEKPPTHEEVAKPGLCNVTNSQGVKKHVWYVKVDDPSFKKGKGKPKKGAEEKTYYVQVLEPDVHCRKELADLTDREKRRLLNGVLNLTVVWVQSSSKKLAEQGKYRVKEMVDIIKIDRIMLRLWHYVELEYEEMEKEEWNVKSSFFRSKRQLLE